MADREVGGWQVGREIFFSLAVVVVMVKCSSCHCHCHQMWQLWLLNMLKEAEIVFLLAKKQNNKTNNSKQGRSSFPWLQLSSLSNAVAAVIEYIKGGRNSLPPCKKTKQLKTREIFFSLAAVVAVVEFSGCSCHHSQMR